MEEIILKKNKIFCWKAHPFSAYPECPLSILGLIFTLKVWGVWEVIYVGVSKLIPHIVWWSEMWWRNIYALLMTLEFQNFGHDDVFCLLWGSSIFIYVQIYTFGETFPPLVIQSTSTTSDPQSNLLSLSLCWFKSMVCLWTALIN